MPERQVLPVLPLRGTVILPGPTITLSVARPGALRALEAAMQGASFAHMHDAACKQEHAQSVGCFPEKRNDEARNQHLA